MHTAWKWMAGQKIAVGDVEILGLVTSVILFYLSNRALHVDINRRFQVGKFSRNERYRKRGGREEALACSLLYPHGPPVGVGVGTQHNAQCPHCMSATVIRVGPPGYFTHFSITTPIVSALKNYYR